MAILKAAVEKLRRVENLVWVESESTSHNNRRDPEQVIALALVTIDNTANILCFLEGSSEVFTLSSRSGEPFRYGGSYLHLDFVNLVRHPFFHGPRSSAQPEPVDKILAQLINASLRVPHFNLLEFLPTKPVYPHYENFREVERLFENETVAPEFLLLLAPKDRDAQDVVKPEYGNLLGVMDDGVVYWINSQGKAPHQPLLKVAGCVGDEKGLYRFADEPCFPSLPHLVNTFNHNGWVVSQVCSGASVITAKVTSPEPPRVDTEESIQAGLQQILVNQKISDDSLALLKMINKKILDEAVPGLSKELNGRLDTAINEAFITVDGVGVKKRAEIKEGILKQFQISLSR